MGEGAAYVVEHKEGNKWVFVPVQHADEYDIGSNRFIWCWLDHSYNQEERCIGDWEYQPHSLSRARRNSKCQPSAEGRKRLRQWSLGYGWYTFQELFDDAATDLGKIKNFGDFLDCLKKICGNEDPANYRILFGFFP